MFLNMQLVESEHPGLLFGKVRAVSPLTLFIDNRFEVRAGDFNVIVSSLCLAGTPGGEGLQVGDLVRILRLNGGQLFYVLEKERYEPVRHCEWTDCQSECCKNGD